MNIAYDGLYAIKGDGNGERYLRHVIKSLATDFPANKYFLYIPSITDKERLDLVEKFHNVEYHLPAASGFQGKLWRMFGVTNCLQADKIDLYHGLNGLLPLNIASAHVPTVITIHEPEASPFKRGYSWFLRTTALHLLGASVRAATRIIVYSEEARAELVARYDADPHKIDCLHSVENIAPQLMAIYDKAIEEFKN